MRSPSRRVAALLAPLLIAKTAGDNVLGRARRPLRFARRAALGWALVIVLKVVFTTSDLFAVPVNRLDPLMDRSFRPTSAKAGAGGADASHPHRTLRGERQPQLAILSLLVHIVTVSLWVAGVGALWWLARHPAPRTGLALRRFSSPSCGTRLVESTNQGDGQVSGSTRQGGDLDRVHPVLSLGSRRPVAGEPAPRT